MANGRGRGSKQGEWAHLYRGRWRRYRIEYLQHNPLCRKCALEGRVTPATVVHHVIPHKGDLALFWDPKNHAPSCAPHHDSTEQAIERGSPRPLIGVDGWPVEDEATGQGNGITRWSVEEDD